MTKDQPKNSFLIKISRNGPYRVSGPVPLRKVRIIPKRRNLVYDQVMEYPLESSTALCRCGKTGSAPFCDGSHEAFAFDGTETASMAPFAIRAEKLEGQTLDLLDDSRCAYARFCYRKLGDAWELTVQSGDPDLRREAIQAASDCPSGRLVAVEKDGQLIEPDLEPSIEVLEDVLKAVSGPLFVKGGIPIESACGKRYEIQNRVTLCRCGQSGNMPFCDRSHYLKTFKATEKQPR